jgi:TrkA-N domain
MIRWARRNWWVPVTVAVLLASAGLGFWGFREMDAGRSVSDDLYLTLQLFSVNVGGVAEPIPWQVEVARYLAPIGAFLFAFGLLSLIVSAVTSRDWSLVPRTGHVVICGLGHKGRTLARAFSADNEVVAIEQEKEVESLEDVRRHGVHVIEGSATDRGILRRACVHRASRLIAVLGDDGQNVKVAALVRELVDKERPERLDPIQAQVHVYNRELRELLAPILEHRSERFVASPFNVFDAAAQELCRAELRTLDGEPDHVMVIGFGSLGESLLLALEASHRRGRAEGGRRRARPTYIVVDQRAAEKVEALQKRHDHLGEVELVAETLDVESVGFEQGEFLDRHARDLDAVVVCFDNDAKSVITALTVAKVMEQKSERCDILARVRAGGGGLASLLDGELGEPYARVRPFSTSEIGCRREFLEGPQAPSDTLAG